MDRYQQSPARKKSLEVDGAILLAWADAGSTNPLWSSAGSVLWSLADGIVDLELSSLQRRLALAAAIFGLAYQRPKHGAMWASLNFVDVLELSAMVCCCEASLNEGLSWQLGGSWSMELAQLRVLADVGIGRPFCMNCGFVFLRDLATLSDESSE